MLKQSIERLDESAELSVNRNNGCWYGHYLN
jgi:hypothetical protein